jgi:tRNA pseudouridine65 synthase
VHGDGKQNKIFTQQLHISDMFLHARKISFVHPVTGEMLVVDAPFPEHWSRVKEMDNLE